MNNIIGIARKTLDQGLCFDMNARITRATDDEIIKFAEIITENANSTIADLIYALNDTATHIEAMMSHIEHKPDRFKMHCYSKAVAARLAIDKAINK